MGLSRVAGAESERTRGRELAFAAMIVIYGLAYFQRTGIPGTIFDELQHDFRLSASAVTALGSVFVYVYASMQLMAGMAADRYGGRKTLLFGSLVMCVGAAVFPCAHTASLLFISRILIGFGSSFVYLSIVKEVDTLFSAGISPACSGCRCSQAMPGISLRRCLSNAPCMLSGGECRWVWWPG